MTLLTHVLKVDTRRHRWLIAGWIVATVATVGMQTWAPFFQSGRRGIETVDLAITFGWSAQILLAGLLLPLIVHTHPAVGTTAFWMTRPLPPATLVRSKLLLLLTLFLGVPAICDAVMMLFYGVPTGDLWLALLEASLQRGTLIMAIASIAVLTRNLAGFALALSGIVVTCAVVIAAWIVLSMLRAEERAGYAILTATTGDSLSLRRSFTPGSRGDLLATAVAIAAGILLISLQYRTRNTRRTIGIGLAALGIVFAIPPAWPRPILQANPELPTWTQDWSAARIVNLDMSVNVERGPEIDGPSGWRIARGRVQMEGVPPGWLAVTRLKSAVVSTGTGVITSEAIGHAAVLNSSRRGQQETPLSTALKHHLGVDTVIWGGLYSGETLVFLSVPSQPALDREFVGGYRGEFAVDLEEMSVAAVLPLDRTSMFQSGALRVTFTGHRWFDSGVHVRYRISDIHSSRFDARPADSYQFYLRSPSRKQAVGGHTSGGAPYFAPRLELRGVYAPSASPFYADLREMTFSTQYFGRNDAVSVDQSWMNDAEIVIVRVRRVGTITRTLEIPQLRFVPSRP